MKNQRIIELNNIDYDYIYNNILQIIDDIIGIYLYVKEDINKENNVDNINISTNNIKQTTPTNFRTKLIIKTLLTSLIKKDILIINKYYDIFDRMLLSNNNLNEEQLNNIDLGLALSLQIRLILDKDNVKDIVEKTFFNLEDKNFYLFRLKENEEYSTKNTNTQYITSYDEIENIKEEFILFYQNIVVNVGKELLKKYFE